MARGVLVAGGVDGVLFDVDDTLIDTKAAFGQAIYAAARVFLPHLPVERYREVLDLWRADPSGHYRAYTRGEIGFDEQRFARANELQAGFGGRQLDDAGYREWKQIFWGTFERAWAAHDDVRAALVACARAGVRVGAVSNASRALQTEKLAVAGLGRAVPMLVGMDTFGVGKPDPRVFLEGCRLLGTTPGRTAYVGDELDIDAGGAAAAGLVGVWLDRPGARRGGPALEDPSAARRRGLVVISGLDALGAALGLTRGSAGKPTTVG